MPLPIPVGGHRSLGGRLPRAHDRQLRGNAGVLPGSLLDHRPLYLFQSSRSTRAMSRTSRAWAIRSMAASRRTVTYPPPKSPAPTATRRHRLQPDQPNARTSTQFKTQRPTFADQDLERRLEEKGVAITGRRRERVVLVQAAGQLRPDAAADRRLRLDQSPRRGGSRGRALRPRPQPRQALQRRCSRRSPSTTSRGSTRPRTS